VSKGVEDGRKVVSGVTPAQGVEGSGMPGPNETLESPWPPLAIRPWCQERKRTLILVLISDDDGRLMNPSLFSIIIIENPINRGSFSLLSDNYQCFRLLITMETMETEIIMNGFCEDEQLGLIHGN
jgi:hypothetical protein